MRSITAAPPVSPRRLHGGRPILEPVADHPWESRVVLNAAAVLVDAVPFDLPAVEGPACVMLYRAQGERVDGAAPSALGLAVFTPELDLRYRRPDPILTPIMPYDAMGVEDPRCTRIDDTYFLYYTGYAGGDDVAICLATTRDFLTWERHGPAEGGINDVPNKNPALLPEQVDGRWLLLHRPMKGPDAMTIHWADSSSPYGPWRSRGKLMESYPYGEFDRSWIGAGGPPVALGDERFLLIYHQGHFTPEGTREYDLAAALLDFEREDPVVARIEPLMRPTGSFEQVGDPDLGVDNVLFTCANFVSGEDLIIPYAGADSRIFGAAISLAELVEALGRA